MIDYTLGDWALSPALVVTTSLQNRIVASSDWHESSMLQLSTTFAQTITSS